MSKRVAESQMGREGGFTGDGSSGGDDQKTTAAQKATAAQMAKRKVANPRGGRLQRTHQHSRSSNAASKTTLAQVPASPFGNIDPNLVNGNGNIQQQHNSFGFSQQNGQSNTQRSFTNHQENVPNGSSNGSSSGTDSQTNSAPSSSFNFNITGTDPAKNPFTWDDSNASSRVTVTPGFQGSIFNLPPTTSIKPEVVRRRDAPGWTNSQLYRNGYAASDDENVPTFDSRVNEEVGIEAAPSQQINNVFGSQPTVTPKNGFSEQSKSRKRSAEEVDGGSTGKNGQAQGISNPFAALTSNSQGQSSSPGIFNMPQTQGQLNLFGGATPNQSHDQANLFGTTTPQQPQSRSNLFGSAIPQQTPGQANLFGTTTLQSSQGQSNIFGSTMPRQTPGQADLFGTTTLQPSQDKPNLFGNTTPQWSQGHSNIFGSTLPQQTQGQPNLFGSIAPQEPESQSNMFGRTYPQHSEGQSISYATSNTQQPQRQSNLFGKSNPPQAQEQGNPFGHITSHQAQGGFNRPGNTNPQESQGLSPLRNTIPQQGESQSELFRNSSLHQVEGPTNLFGDPNSQNAQGNPAVAGESSEHHGNSDNMADFSSRMSNNQQIRSSDSGIFSQMSSQVQNRPPVFNFFSAESPSQSQTPASSKITFGSSNQPQDSGQREFLGQGSTPQPCDQAPPLIFHTPSNDQPSIEDDDNMHTSPDQPSLQNDKHDMTLNIDQTPGSFAFLNQPQSGTSLGNVIPGQGGSLFDRVSKPSDTPATISQSPGTPVAALKAPDAPTTTFAPSVNSVTTTNSPANPPVTLQPSPSKQTDTLINNEQASVNSTTAEPATKPSPVTNGFMPQIPKHFTEAQRRHYITCFMLRSLDMGFKKYIDISCFSADPHTPYQYYMERRQEILSGKWPDMKILKNTINMTERQESASGPGILNVSIPQIATNPETTVTDTSTKPRLYGRTLSETQEQSNGKRKHNEELSKDIPNGAESSAKRPRFANSGSDLGISDHRQDPNIKRKADEDLTKDIDNGSDANGKKARFNNDNSILALPSPTPSSQSSQTLNTFKSILGKTDTGSPGASVNTQASKPLFLSPKAQPRHPDGKANDILTKAGEESSSAGFNVSPQKPQPEIPKIQVPNFGKPVNFMSQFSKAAEKTAQQEKEKRKAEEFDSDEDDEAEWERKYAEAQRTKKQKLAESASAKIAKYVPGKGFAFVDDNNAGATVNDQNAASIIPQSISSDASAKLNSAEPTTGRSKNSLDASSPTQSINPGSSVLFNVGGLTVDTAKESSNIFAHLSKSSSNIKSSERNDAGDGNPQTENEDEEGNYKGAHSSGNGLKAIEKPIDQPQSSSRSLFERISRDDSGNAIRETQSTEVKKSENPFQQASSATSSNFFGLSGSPSGDNTWRQDSPIKFTSSSNAPTFSLNAASPIKPTSTSPTTPLTGLFGKAKSSKDSPNEPTSETFSQSPASTSSTAVGFGFGGPLKPTGGSLAAPIAAPSITSGSPPPNSSTSGGTADGADEEAVHHEQIDLSARGEGEEDEDVLFEVKAKALLFDMEKKTWVSKGVGPLRVLKHRTSKQTRMLMRQAPSGKLVLNSALIGAMNYEYTNQKGVKFGVATDGGKLSTWLIKVGADDDAATLARVLQDNRSI